MPSLERLTEMQQMQQMQQMQPTQGGPVRARGRSGAVATTTAQTPRSWRFGAVAAVAGGRYGASVAGGRYGAPASTPAPAPAPAPAAGGLFGASAPAPAPAPAAGGLFGASAPAPAAGNQTAPVLFGGQAPVLFGIPAQAPVTGLFGASAPAAGGLFGAPAPAPATAPAPAPAEATAEATAPATAPATAEAEAPAEAATDGASNDQPALTEEEILQIQTQAAQLILEALKKGENAIKKDIKREVAGFELLSKEERRAVYKDPWDFASPESKYVNALSIPQLAFLLSKLKPKEKPSSSRPDLRLQVLKAYGLHNKAALKQFMTEDLVKQYLFKPTGPQLRYLLKALSPGATPSTCNPALIEQVWGILCAKHPVLIERTPTPAEVKKLTNDLKGIINGYKAKPRGRKQDANSADGKDAEQLRVILETKQQIELQMEESGIPVDDDEVKRRLHALPNFDFKLVEECFKTQTDESSSQAASPASSKAASPASFKPTSRALTAEEAAEEMETETAEEAVDAEAASGGSSKRAKGAAEETVDAEAASGGSSKRAKGVLNLRKFV